MADPVAYPLHTRPGMPITTSPSPTFESIDVAALSNVQGGCGKKKCCCPPQVVQQQQTIIAAPTPAPAPMPSSNVSTSVSVSYQ
jgi:hypothetical protein